MIGYLHYDGRVATYVTLSDDGIVGRYETTTLAPGRAVLSAALFPLRRGSRGEGIPILASPWPDRIGAELAEDLALDYVADAHSFAAIERRLRSGERPSTLRREDSSVLPFAGSRAA